MVADKEMKKVISFLANGVFSTNLEPENVDEKILDTIRFFDSRQVGSWSWRVTHTSKPSNLAESLEAHGFTMSGDGTPGMAVDLGLMRDDFPKPDGLVVKSVADDEALEDFIGVCVPVFFSRSAEKAREVYRRLGIPWFALARYYVGYLNGKAVATSCVILKLGAAGLYAIATVPEARGKGIGTEMTLAPLRDARDLGYRVGILHSSKMGFPVYQRIGFQTYCQMMSYKPPEKRE